MATRGNLSSSKLAQLYQESKKENEPKPSEATQRLLNLTSIVGVLESKITSSAMLGEVGGNRINMGDVRMPAHQIDAVLEYNCR